MSSIVRIIQSQDILGSKDYTNPDTKEFGMFLYSKNKHISPKSVIEFPCNVSVGDLGFKYGTPSNPHYPIHMGFAATQTSSASLNVTEIAEIIHYKNNGSTDITTIFKDIFPNISGELILHEKSNGTEENICNQQWYKFGHVDKKFQEEIKKEYTRIMGQELLPF